MALFRKGKRSADIVAITDVDLLVIKNERLEWLIHNRPEVTIEILKSLSDAVARGRTQTERGVREAIASERPSLRVEITRLDSDLPPAPPRTLPTMRVSTFTRRAAGQPSPPERGPSSRLASPWPFRPAGLASYCPVRVSRCTRA